MHVVMEWWWPEYTLPILGAVIAGGLIGYEREHRGRAAGMRTHMLLCLASTLLMLAAVHQVRWMADTPEGLIRIDPVRMAHGVLTGIGFLCGGVIFREGFSVRGLTSAASLWTTAALGVLYGIGLFGLAVGGTLATLFVLAGLRMVEDRLPRLRHVDITVRYGAHAATQAELAARLAALALTPDVVTHRRTGEGVELASTFRSPRRIDAQAIADSLSADPRVIAFEVSPRHE
jgi:putative Mg2+ transporter-C (MgtC) family protein